MSEELKREVTNLIAWANSLDTEARDLQQQAKFKSQIACEIRTKAEKMLTMFKAEDGKEKE